MTPAERLAPPYLVLRCDCGDDAELTPENLARDLCSDCGMRRKVTEARPPHAPRTAR